MIADTTKLTLYSLMILGLWFLSACRSQPKEKTQPDTFLARAAQPVSHNAARRERVQTDNLIFIKYLDDGDYPEFVAKKGDNTVSFINKTDTARNINHGDSVQVNWKPGSVSMPGDNGVATPARLLVSVRKTGDGPVTKFRKAYGKVVKYTWAADEDYSSSYLDELYLLVEDYLANTRSPLLQHVINKRIQLTYSIESNTRNDERYTMIGIAPEGPNGSNVVQWLYIRKADSQIFEYNLAEDNLIPFK
ncbi:hypothetical protein [Pedobacter sp. SYP-B3415]|uniref:hypothetical protein n=1 Tax=Pedobacter sp. SYP-B3415 TaxID=2496641 RepID=UPI00101C6DF8|nr:hypothetical protein [Pedobacter sp. SYP-B3415]